MRSYRVDDIQNLDFDKLSKQVADVNAPLTEGEAKGWTLICVAIFQGRLDKVKELIDAGADFKSALPDGVYKGYTPIYTAARCGNEDIVRFLVEQGVDFKSPLQDGNGKGYTPIFAAARYGHEGIVRFLVGQGVDFRSPLQDGDGKGYTLIYFAAGLGQEGIVRFLVVEKNVDFRSALQGGRWKGYTPVYIAAEKGHEHVVRFLIERGVDFRSALQDGSKKGFTPIFIAAASGHVNIVRFLIECGADFILALQDGTVKGFTPLFIAAKSNHILVVRTILMYWISKELLSGPISLLINLSSMFQKQKYFAMTLDARESVIQELGVINLALQESLKEVCFFNRALSLSMSAPWLPSDCLKMIAYQNFLKSVNCSYDCFSNVFYAHGDSLRKGMEKINGVREEVKKRIRDANHNMKIEPLAKRARDAADDVDETITKKPRIGPGFFSPSLNDRQVEMEICEPEFDRQGIVRAMKKNGGVNVCRYLAKPLYKTR